MYPTLIFFGFCGKVLLCCPGWPGTHTPQASLEFMAICQSQGPPPKKTLVYVCPIVFSFPQFPQTYRLQSLSFLSPDYQCMLCAQLCLFCPPFLRGRAYKSTLLRAELLKRVGFLQSIIPEETLDSCYGEELICITSKMSFLNLSTYDHYPDPSLSPSQ